MVGYAIGIVITFTVMIVFDHAQPALLFLVPCCTLSVVIVAFIHKQLKDVTEYDEENIRNLLNPEKKEEEEKELKEKKNT